MKSVPNQIVILLRKRAEASEILDGAKTGGKTEEMAIAKVKTYTDMIASLRKELPGTPIVGATSKRETGSGEFRSII